MPHLLQNWVTRQAHSRPDAVAVVLNQQRMTYRQLEKSSNQLARILRAGGCQKGDRVCVLVPKSPAAIVAFLGILKADCIYVPIDASSPAARVAKIFDSCENRWMLAAGPVASLLGELFSKRRFRQKISLGVLDKDRNVGPSLTAEFCWSDVESYPSTAMAGRCTSGDAAHILFTSGSTGTPKGVVITHSNVRHFVEWACKYFGMSSSDRTSGHAPLHFDLSTFDIYGTFAVGAELHLVPAELNLLPNKLADFIRTRGLTQWFSVPSVLNYMAKFDAVRLNDFPSLKRVLWCGEVFPTAGLAYWMKRLPKVSFTNLYGPTETTIASSFYAVPKCPENDKALIPIGTACEGEGLLILDANLEPIPPGKVGDLYIRGVGLSPGYWRDPEKTCSVFLPKPLHPSDRLYRTGDLASIGNDGLVYFHGRSDNQIKSRGYRIELGEIEAALNTIEVLRECAVVALQTNGFEGTAICCAYIGAPNAVVSPTVLRKELSKVLPSYMLPSRWMALGQLAKNANGKIDRPQLKKLFEQTETQTSQ